MQPLRTSECSQSGSNHSTFPLSTRLLYSCLALHGPAVLSLHTCNSQISRIQAKEPVIHQGTSPNQHNCPPRSQYACCNCGNVSRHGGAADSSWSSFGPEGGAAPPGRHSWSPGACCCTPHRSASLLPHSIMCTTASHLLCCSASEDHDCAMLNQRECHAAIPRMHVWVQPPLQLQQYKPAYVVLLYVPVSEKSSLSSNTPYLQPCSLRSSWLWTSL